MTPARETPVAFELFKNALYSVANEMALTIFRTAYSPLIKEVMDYSTALTDGNGRTVAQGLTLPGHLCSFPGVLATILQRYGSTMEPGDVYCLNDPYEGGQHLPDIFIIKPIFVDGERLAFAATVCHHSDVGGRVAGSNASDSTEIYQEGLRIPAIRLYEAGRPNDAVFRLLEKNVRIPRRVLGDLRAQLAACHIAEQAFTRFTRRYGATAVKRFMTELLAYTERMTRAAIRQLPDGEYTFEDWNDDDGIDIGVPIRLQVRIAKVDDRLIVDWTGSSPQVKGAVNNTIASTRAATYTCIKSVLPLEIPNNAGFYAPIEVIAPLGTVTNAEPPAAVASRGLTNFRLVDCCFGALAKMLPNRVFAASEGGNTGITIGGYYSDRRPFVYVDFVCSAWGGRPWTDGLDGNAHIFVNLASQPAEMCEIENPVEILACEFIQDSGGPGKFRGGMSVRRDYRFLEKEALLQVRSDRHVHRPYGLYGGKPGRPSENILNPGTENRDIGSKPSMMIKQDDVYRHEQPGAGGWGDPLERDAARVLKDVRNGFVSLASAADDYGVIIDPTSRRVDGSATHERRLTLRQRRGSESLPFVSR